MTDVIEKVTDKTSLETSNSNMGQLLTIRQFCAKYPWPSESAMRSYIYRADVLGISEAFVRVGRRVLIMPNNFFLLIKQIEKKSTQGGVYETRSWQKREVCA